MKKYPRTLHLPWSLGITNDDKVLKSTSCFSFKYIIVSEKMDGENTTLYNDGLHARSLTSSNHISRTWIKQWWSKFKHDIPKNMRICGENMYAKHSIYYDSLESYFLGFSVWIDDVCLSWQHTLEWFEVFNISTVPIIECSVYDEEEVKNICFSLDMKKHEVIVIRNSETFLYDEFSNNVGKFVRKNHVTTDTHWMNSNLILNNIRKS
jgi:ATP-dependent RNA circularization protein (DNA/RNA ligase family)